MNYKLIIQSINVKWGHLKVDDINATSFKNLESVMRHIKRDMETDLVVEYLRGVQK